MVFTQTAVTKELIVGLGRSQKKTKPQDGPLNLASAKRNRF